jgi:hypothetical protein
MKPGYPSISEPVAGVVKIRSEVTGQLGSPGPLSGGQ